MVLLHDTVLDSALLFMHVHVRVTIYTSDIYEYNQQAMNELNVKQLNYSSTID